MENAAIYCASESLSRKWKELYLYMKWFEIRSKKIYVYIYIIFVSSVTRLVAISKIIFFWVKVKMR